ncbi:MinD/ParA family protein [Anaerosinus massiliensis]|uniref:MinD/ParA family protein n=1 Tax=Massilibacillus massiliensis TaxID=1806837 RepID=UPI000B1F27E0|nr:MinD/ParA family protein [Massilibacillus massiliensis]
MMEIDQAESLRKLVNGKQSVIKKQQFIEFDHSNRNLEHKARIIAVSSGKGGVGKTNITVNLAIALSMQGTRVLIIDADLGMANVDVVLGTSSKHNLLKLLQDDINLEDVLVDGPCGVKYLSGGSGIEQLANLGYSAFDKLMRKLNRCEDIADIILLDTGAGIGNNVLNFLKAADEVILVTTPEPTAMTDVYAIMKAYSNCTNHAKIKLIVNRVYETGEATLVVSKLSKTALKFLNLTVIYFGEIYEDRNLIRAVKAQVPLILMYPNTVSAKCIKHIAKNLTNGEVSAKAKGLKGFVNKFMSFLR